MPDSQRVEGYVSCRGNCGEEWLLKAVAKRTGGFCQDCWMSGIAKPIAALEAEAKGRRVKMPPKHKKRKRPNRGRASTARLADTARWRARKRLAEIYADMYVVLLAQERAKLGLEPLPLEALPHSGSTTIDLDSVYRMAGQTREPAE